jgi:hypothetical protein
MTEYKRGDEVLVTLKGTVKFDFSGRPGDGLEVEVPRMLSLSSTVTHCFYPDEQSLGISVTKPAVSNPEHWPPQPGDLWHTIAGDGFVRGDKQMVFEDGSNVHTDNLRPTSSWRLIHRKGNT